MNRLIVAIASICALLVTSFAPPQEPQEDQVHGPSFSLVAEPGINEVTLTTLNEPAPTPVATFGAPILIQIVDEVANDEKLPLDVIPRTTNDKVGTATNLQYTVAPVAAGTFETPATAPAEAYFVPADGYTGPAVITVTGDNKKGDPINGSVTVTVLAGPAVRLEIVPLAPVPK